MFNNQIASETPVEAAVIATDGGRADSARADSDRPEKTAIRIELPRQLLFLILSAGLAAAVLALLAVLTAVTRDFSGIVWSRSMVTRQPLDELLPERLGNSLILLLSAHFLALFLAMLPVIVAWLADRLEGQVGLAGSIVKGLGRLWAFSQGMLPIAALGMLLFLVFVVELRWLPPGGLASPGRSSLGDRLQHLILPTITLALLPAVLTAQAAARRLTLPDQARDGWHWLAGAATLLGVWLGLVGYLLSGLVVVEVLFSWPGIGRLMYDSLLRLDLPVFFGTLAVMLALLIPARLGSIFFRWLARWSTNKPATPGEPVGPAARADRQQWRPKAARIWLIFCLILLLVPLVVFIAGATVDPDEALTPDMANRLAAPSVDHPWGTDDLGRDLRSTALRGSYSSLGSAFLASLALTLFAGSAGSVAGFLAGRRSWWAESLADLLLLPADALLLFPAIPLAMAILLLLAEPGQAAIIIALLLTLFPRMMRATHSLWLNQPENSRVIWRIVFGAGAILVAGCYAALALDVGLGFLGLGLPPPAPTLGQVLYGPLRFLLQTKAAVTWIIVLVLLCAVSLYLAADALIGYFTTKETMARLNE